VTSFPVSPKPGAYETSIIYDIKGVIRASTEAIHKFRINDYHMHDAALHATHGFILAVIADAYVHTLKDLTTYYATSTPVPF